MGFVLVQHLDPGHQSALTQLLRSATRMPVQEVSNNLPVEPNQVYVIPPNTSLVIAQGTLRLHARQSGRGSQHSIDGFLESLAHDQHETAIGVILSGTASDGTVGLEAIKAEGGITFAQDSSARYDSMPRNAIAAGCVDLVLSPENIAKELARIAKHPYVAAEMRKGAVPGTPDKAREPSADERAADDTHRDDSRRASPVPVDSDLKKILLLLRNRFGVDFSMYKSGTIQRRITRRMVLGKVPALDAYLRLLRESPKEVEALHSDLLINVTSFFRNP
jgi:two-component system, chemotaxis family, CheB/CheR fusion protein